MYWYSQIKLEFNKSNTIIMLPPSINLRHLSVYILIRWLDMGIMCVPRTGGTHSSFHMATALSFMNYTKPNIIQGEIYESISECCEDREPRGQ